MPDAGCILALDHNKRNLELLTQFLVKSSFGVHPVSSLEELDSSLASGVDFNLALLDVAGFDTRIWDRCNQLRERGIPFLIISPNSAQQIERTSLSHGAKGILVKPLSPKSLLGLIQALVNS